MKSGSLKSFVASLCLTPFLLTTVVSEEDNVKKGGVEQTEKPVISKSSSGDRLVRQIAEISRKASQKGIPAEEVIAFFKKVIPEVIANNKDLRQSRCAVAQAMGAMSNARGEFLPTANLAVGYSASDSRKDAKKWNAQGENIEINGQSVTKSKNKSWGSSVSFDVGYNLFNGFGSVAQIDLADNTVRAEYKKYKDQEGTILLNVFTKIIEVITQRITILQYEASVAIFKAILQQSLDQMRVGAVSRSDVANAESNLAECEAKLEFAKIECDAAVSDFELWTGLSAKEIPLMHPDFSKMLPVSVEEMKTLGEQNSSGLWAARYTAKAKKAALAKAKSGLSPKVDVSASAGQNVSYSRAFNYDNDRDAYNWGGKDREEAPHYQVGVKLSVPLDFNGALRTGIGGARHDYVKAQVNEIQTRDQVFSDIETEYGKMLNAQKIVAAFKRQVAAEQIRLQCDLQELSVGAAVYIQVLKGQKDLLDAQTDLAKAQRTLATCQAKLLKMTGRLNGKFFGIPTMDFNIDVPASTGVELERMYPEFKDVQCACKKCSHKAGPAVKVEKAVVSEKKDCKGKDCKKESKQKKIEEKKAKKAKKAEKEVAKAAKKEAKKAEKALKKEQEVKKA